MAKYQDVEGPESMGGISTPYGSNEGYWGGQRGGVHAEFYTDENGVKRHRYVTKEGGSEIDARDYRNRGAAAAQRSAYQGDYSGFDQAGRGFEYGQGQARQAMDLQRSAAEGRAPSAAEIAGRAAIGQSLDAQMAAGASARGGPLAQAAATRAAQANAAAFRQQAVQGIQAGRANEMAQARGAYAGTSLQYGQNQLGQQQSQLGKTQQQLAAEMEQRRLNQQAEQYYESKRFDTKSAGLAADFARRGQLFNEASFDRSEDRADDQFEFNRWNESIKRGTEMGGSLGTSDTRAKNVLVPAGKSDSPWFQDEDEAPDIQRSDPYEPEMNAMLDDRERQGGHQRAASWLDHYIEKEQAPAPRAAAPAKPPMSYEFGWGDTGREDEERGQAPGTADFEKYAYSDKEAKDLAYARGREDGVKAGVENAEKLRALAALSRKQEARAVGHMKPPPRPSDRDYEMYQEIAHQQKKRSDALAAGRPVVPATELGRASSGVTVSRPAPAPSPAPVEPPQMEASLIRSDEDAKERTIDLDEEERTVDLDKPEFDQRETSKGLWFHRGTREENKRDLRNFQDKAGASADSDIAGMRASLEAGPSVKPDRGSLVELQKDANRRMESAPYTYKDGFVPPEQERGEMNFGPMAQELEKNPLTATTVKKDARGMRLVDMHKLVKTQAGSIASLQKQIDELRGAQ